MLHMVSNDITMKQNLGIYRQLFTDCTFKMNCDTSTLACANKQGYLQRFVAEAVSCYLVTGFVVFRFFEIEIEGTKKLVPIMVPILEIEWMYENGEINYESDIVVPDVLIPLAGINNKTRFYVYKFGNHNGISSTSLGIVFDLIHPYKKWMQAEEYNQILQKENLQSTVYVEQKIVPDSSVSGGGGSHSVASAPLISRIAEARSFRTTTHAPPLPTATDEIRDSIQVYSIASTLHTMLHVPIHAATDMSVENTGTDPAARLYQLCGDAGEHDCQCQSGYAYIPRYHEATGRICQQNVESIVCTECQCIEGRWRGEQAAKDRGVGSKAQKRQPRAHHVLHRKHFQNLQRHGVSDGDSQHFLRMQ